MKKILFIISAFLSLNLSANPDVQDNERIDQFQNFMGVFSTAYYRALEISEEKGYNYFKFLKVSYQDESGQTMQINGVCQDKDGDIIKGTIVDEIPFAGKMSCDYEIICFKEVVKDKTVCDIQKFRSRLKKFKSMQKKLKDQE